jgi:nucleoside-diphosphate-sugar epimerase
MKIAITGSNSNFGIFLSKYFKKNVYKISKKKKFFLENADQYNLKNKKINVLIHLAHEYSKKGKVLNYEGSIKLFENAIKSKIKKIIFISSLSSHINALSDYGKTKYLIERFCLKNNIIIVRPGLIFGFNENDKKLKIAKQIIKFIPIIPYFINKKSFIFSVHIEELIKKMCTIILKESNYKIFNIYSPNKIYFEDLINLIIKNKLKIKIPFFIFKFFFVFLSKIFYFKIFDSFLSLAQNKQKYIKKYEKNIFTKKSLIKDF